MSGDGASPSESANSLIMLSPNRILPGALLVLCLVPRYPDAAELDTERADSPPEPALATSFDGMRIISFSRQHVETSAGRFDIRRTSIVASRAGEEEAVIRFPARFLNGLKAARESETIYFSNSRLRLSISADSVLRIEFDRDVDQGPFSVSLGQYRTAHFETGAFLGIADGRRGIYFSPTWSRKAIESMPRAVNRTLISSTGSSGLWNP